MVERAGLGRASTLAPQGGHGQLVHDRGAAVVTQFQARAGLYPAGTP